MAFNDYVLIGNFGLDYDALHHKFMSAQSGQDFKDFFQRVTYLTEKLGLKIVEFYNDSLVVTGDAQDVAYIEKYFGDVYSCARIGQDEICLVRAYQLVTQQPKGVKYDA